MLAMIGLGSSEGDRLGYLRSAVRAFAEGEVEDTRLLAASRVYETRPIGPSDQPYLNAAVALETSLEPEVLLAALKRIEAENGRVRHARWASRTLDLDFLLLGRGGAWITKSTDALTLPHPQVFERDFVMHPLLDLQPDLTVGEVRLETRLASLPEAERTILRVLDARLLPG
jgi:2-amino-4-hydroxy-6-hydroxymethyldihydropteridine diphosphokinase